MFGDVCVANFVDTFGIIFGNLQNKGGILPNSSEVGRKSFGKSSKTSLSACLYNKKNNSRLVVEMGYLFSCSTLYPFAVLNN